MPFRMPTYEELDAQVPDVLSSTTASLTFHYPQYAWDDEHLIVTLIVKEGTSAVPKHSRCLVVYAPADGSAATFLDVTAAIEKEAHQLDPDDDYEYFSVFGACARKDDA